MNKLIYVSDCCGADFPKEIEICPDCGEHTSPMTAEEYKEIFGDDYDFDSYSPPMLP